MIPRKVEGIDVALTRRDQGINFAFPQEGLVLREVKMLFGVRRLRHALWMSFAIMVGVMLPGSAWADDYRQGVKSFQKGKYSESIALLKPLASAGDPFAQHALAVMYDDGLGVPQDLNRALHWYSEAAEGGLVDSQYVLGRFYGRGRVGKQRPSEAFFWFNIAAAGGHPDAARLRDQQSHQIRTAQKVRLEDLAVEWHKKHPVQLTCKSNVCIYPSWVQSAQWRRLY